MGIVRTPAGGGGGTVIIPTRASTAVVTSPAVTNVAGTILAANADRLGCEIVNPPGGSPGDARMYVKKGAGASSTDFTFYLDPGDYYTDDNLSPYSGLYSAILTSAGPRDAQVTEETP